MITFIEVKYKTTLFWLIFAGCRSMLVLVRNPKGREMPERAMQGSSWLWVENTILQRPHFLWKKNEPERQCKNSMGKQQESKVYVLGEFWSLRLWSLCMDCSACHKWKPLGEDTFPYLLGPNDSKVLNACSYIHIYIHLDRSTLHFLHFT